MTILDNLTPEQRIAEIRDRLKKALEGPYEPQWDSCDCGPEDDCKNGHRWIHALRLPVPRTVNHEGEPAAWEFLYSALGAIPPDTVLLFAHARDDEEFLLSEVDRLKSALANEEATTDRLLGERDDMESLLNKFAYTIAPEEVIGEHSSGNDPWQNALDLLTPAAEVDRLTSERDKARRVAEHAGSAMTKAGLAIEDALRLAATSGADAAIAALRDLLADADLLPSSAHAEPADGGEPPC